MEYRVSDEDLDSFAPDYKATNRDVEDLVVDLKDARAEIDRLNHKVELLQGPGEA